MNQQAAKISAGGRIVLPAQIRASLGIQEGDELLISVVNGEIHITPKTLALQNALAIIRKYLASSPDLSDGLIEDRQKETHHSDSPETPPRAMRLDGLIPAYALQALDILVPFVDY